MPAAIPVHVVKGKLHIFTEDKGDAFKALFPSDFPMSRMCCSELIIWMRV